MFPRGFGIGYQTPGQFDRAREIVQSDRDLSNSVIVESVEFDVPHFVIRWMTFEPDIIRDMCRARNLIPDHPTTDWVPGTPFPRRVEPPAMDIDAFMRLAHQGQTTNATGMRLV
jgi:hypothetical protein